MIDKIILVGNPNTGKTTLFNTICNANQKTANYSGVTVGEVEKTIKLNNKNYLVVDLPGMYSLDGLSKDEQVAFDYLKNNSKNALVCFIATSLTLAKNLYLLLQIKDYVKNICLVINDNGVKFNHNQLTELEDKLNIKIICSDVRKNKKTLVNFLSQSILYCKQHKLNNITYKTLVLLFNPPKIKQQKIDRLLLNKIWGTLIFFILMLIGLVLVFGVLGGYIADLLEQLFKLLGFKFCTFLANKNLVWLASFCNVVIFGAISSIICFIPQLTLLLLYIYILEDVGYLPRVAYLFNLNFNKLGLSGGSIFSLVVGVCCTTSGFMLTRNVKGLTERCQTARLLPFVGCSAKLPISLFVLSKLSGLLSIVYLVILYSIVIISAILVLKINYSKQQNYFILELPRLKKPTLKYVIKECFKIIVQFLYKVAVIVLITSSLMWLLLNISIDFKFILGGSSISILEYIASKFSFLFIPIGLNDSGLIIALISGMIAKENIISSLAIFNSLTNINLIQSCSFVLFVLLYSPCLPAIKTCSQEFGKKFSLKLMIMQILLAYFVCLVFYTFAKSFGFVYGIILCYVVLIALYFILKPNYYKCNKNCKYNCSLTE